MPVGDMTVGCIECGEELLAERAALGYRYCTRQPCQDRHRGGVTVTAIGLNKSGEHFVVGGAEELTQRAAAGEFGKKNTGLGALTLDAAGPALPPPQPQPPRTPTRGRTANSAQALRPWTDAQERVVRLYRDMGLAPHAILERARRNTPRLALSEALVTRILCASRRRA